jgi:hypothetical protein
MPKLIAHPARDADSTALSQARRAADPVIAVSEGCDNSTVITLCNGSTINLITRIDDTLFS